MTSVFQDLKYAFRLLLKSPGFTAVAVLTLALGIGANTAMFSVIYGVLLRPLPFDDPERLVFVWHTPPQDKFPGMTQFSVSPANYLDWKAQSQSFESMTLVGYTRLNLTGAGEPEALTGAQVSTDFFSVLGVAPMLGRTFAVGEDQPGSDPIIVLSYGLWQSHFGADSGVVRRTVNLNGQPYTVAGVMPRSFRFPDDSQFWIPLSWTPAFRGTRGVHDYTVVARLKAGVGIDAANAELATISRRLAEQYPEDNKGWGASVVSLHRDIVGDVRPALLVLLGAVFFVLLIACVNVANLMLAKILGRQKEIAVRNALGASRWRILQQILTESVVLAIVGGVLGSALAYLAVQTLATRLENELPRAADISVDLSVLAFTIAISVAAGLLSGVMPGWRLSSSNVSDALKRGGGRTGDSSGGRTRGVLVITEVALALMLLAGAGLLLRSLWKLQNVDPGFEPRNVLVSYVAVPSKKFTTPEQSVAFFQQLLQSLKSIPGAQSASMVNKLPVSEGSIQPVAIEGSAEAAMAEQPEMPVRLAGPGYFKALGIRLVRGREFNEGDTPERARVALVSEAMAKKFWPNQDPIGKRLSLTFTAGGPREVVGVVADIKTRQLQEHEAPPTVYAPLTQLDPPAPQYGEFDSPGVWVVVRTANDPLGALTSVKNAIQQVLPGTPLIAPQTLEQFIATRTGPQRFNFLLLGAFAAMSVLLAALGIYSVLAYSVRRRTQEIGIRMAIGAQVGDVMRLVLREGMGLVLVGIVAGLIGALMLSRFMQGMLFNVGTTDLPTFLSVAGLLALVALAACFIPARRATKVEPITALRYE